MGRRSSIVLIVVLGLMLAAIGMAAPGSAGGRPLGATMTGPEEVPPGDPDGAGVAHFTLNQGQGEVCFHLEVSNIAPSTAAHIHIGDPGVAGPVVIPLVAPTEGSSEGCVSDVDPALIKAIRHDPGAYYVNVHNAEFPAGAVRGQLSR